MRSVLAGLRNLTLPWGRRAGRRIVLDGTAGTIQAYDDTGLQTLNIDDTGVRVDDVDGSYVKLGHGGGGLIELGVRTDNGATDIHNAYVETNASTGFKPYLGLISPWWAPGGGTSPAQITMYGWGIDSAGTLIDLWADKIRVDGPIYALSTGPTGFEEFIQLPFVPALGWSNFGGGFAAGQIKKLPTNALHILGVLRIGPTRAGAFAALPVGYRPTKSVRVPITVGGAGVPAGATPWLDIDAAGNVSAVNIGAATTTIEVNAIIPLDPLL